MNRTSTICDISQQGEAACSNNVSLLQKSYPRVKCLLSPAHSVLLNQ